MADVDVIVPIADPAIDPAAATAGLVAHRDTVDFRVIAVVAEDTPDTPDRPDTVEKLDASDTPEPPAFDLARAPSPSPTPAATDPEAPAEAPAEREARFASIGLDAGRSPYAIILRPGDILAPGALGRLVRAARRGGSAGAIGAWIALDPEGRPTGPEADAPLDRAGRARRRIGLDAFLSGFVPAGCSVLLDRASLGTRRHARGLGEAAELDLWLRIVEQGDRFAVVPSVVASRPPGYGGSMGRWGAFSEASIAVIRRSFSRAATLGFEAAGIDLSEAREERAVLALAMRIATRAALADPDPRRAGATELLRPHADRDAITPELAAWAAADALRRSEGFLPAIDGVSERLWSRALRGWWSRCVGERWADKSLVDTGAGLLAEQLVSRTEIAKATMADQAGLWSAGERFCVAGSGADAIAMAAHAARAGCVVELLVPDAAVRVALTPDDIVDPSELSQGSVTVCHIDTPIGVDAPIVVIDEEAPDVLARFAARPNVARWSSGRRKLEQRAVTRLSGVWRQRDVGAMV